MVERRHFDTRRAVFRGERRRLTTIAKLCGASRTSVERWADAYEDVTQAAERYIKRCARRQLAAANGIPPNRLRDRLWKGWDLTKATTKALRYQKESHV